MEVGEMIEKVAEAVQDDSFDSEFYLDQLNKCLGELAAVYQLPNLITTGTVDCVSDSYVIDLPDDYLKGFDSAYNMTKDSLVTVRFDLPTFLKRFPSLDNVSPVTDVCPVGNKLYYQGIPSDGMIETIRFFYTRKATSLERDGDVPIEVPDHLHYDLFVNYACAGAFNLIEEGIDGAKINFNKYTSLYQQAQVRLEKFLGIPQGSPEFIPMHITIEDGTDEAGI